MLASRVLMGGRAVLRGLLLMAAMTAMLGCADGGLEGGRAAAENGSRCNASGEHPWCDTGLTADARADLLVTAMSLEQKIDYLAGDDPASAATCEPYCGVVNGIPALDIPPLKMTDGPVGVRGGPATALPIPLALAASFDPELAFATGRLVGNETRLKGNDLLHAPVADLVRNPLAGRTFETFGEDPELATRLTEQWVLGAQAEGVMANIKHYLMNTQEGIIGVPPLLAVLGGRAVVNVVADERTLREVYLPPYEAAVKQADVASLMCAYNLVNNEPACSSDFLLQQVLRDDWGFEGFLVTDYYFAQKDTIQTANAGAVIEMPFAFWYRPELLQAAVSTGQVSEETLDGHLRDIFTTLFRFGFFDRPDYIRDESRIDQEAHAIIARQTVEQGSVLLRNQGMLPINDGVQSIAVIGLSAQERPTGGGSSLVTPFRFTTPLEGIIARAGDAISVSYADGRDIPAAAELAAAANIALVFANSLSTEGVDKLCLGLDCTLADVPDSALLNLLPAPASEVLDLALDPLLSQSPVAEILEQAFAPILLGGQPLPVSHRNQDALIQAVAGANGQTAVILQNGGPVLTPWRDQVNAILEIWYPGQEVAAGLPAILFGDTDPGGRLPVTFPANESDNLVAGDPTRYPGVANQAQHSEGVFIGYRWFDQQGIAPAYPFGFGLSYTDFSLSDMQVTGGAATGLQVFARVSNIGDRGGWVVPQLYLGLPSPGENIPQPAATLKGFDKIWLDAGEQVRVTLNVAPRGLSYWDQDQSDWVIAAGCYDVMLGQSSRDLSLQVQLPLAGGSC